MKAVLLVLDSVGIGAAPDADAYDDHGCNTLLHCAQAVGALRLPNLARLGLGNACACVPAGPAVPGLAPNPEPLASVGAMQEVSAGKDTTTGHWELAGLELRHGFHHFPVGPPSFPAEFIAEFERRTGRAAIGNKHASGTAIIEELGARQLREGCWIVYTSADSVFQIAAHEDVIPVDELYAACAVARELCDPFPVGRIIARPFVGAPGAFRRTQRRRDFSFPPPEPTVLDRLDQAGTAVLAVGKVEDIYAGHGISESRHTGDNAAAQHAVLKLAKTRADCLIFANLNDYDSLYGHRRNPQGYAEALRKTDRWLAELLPLIDETDLLIVTADHGNDPTFKGTDHTREFVPLLVFQPARPVRELGLRVGFYDVAQSLAAFFGLEPMPRGESFL